MDWHLAEMKRFERRVKMRGIYRNASMWFWPIVAVALSLYCWAKALF